MPAPSKTADFDSNRQIITQAELKKQKADNARKRKAQEAADAKAAKPELSKTAMRKLAQITARKEKEAKRQAVLASLASNQVSAAQLKLLGSSGTLGHQATKKQRLQRAVFAKQEGAELEGLVLDEVSYNAVREPQADLYVATVECTHESEGSSTAVLHGQFASKHAEPHRAVC